MNLSLEAHIKHVAQRIRVLRGLPAQLKARVHGALRRSLRRDRRFRPSGRVFQGYENHPKGVIVAFEHRLVLGIVILASALAGASATPPLHAQEAAAAAECADQAELQRQLERFKASVGDYQRQLRELESELQVAHRAASRQLDEAPSPPSACEPPSALLDELSNLRSTLAVRDGELRRLEDRLRELRSGSGTQQGAAMRALETKLAGAQQRAQALADERARLQHMLEDREQALRESQQRIAALEAAASSPPPEAAEDLAALQTELAMARGTITRLQGELKSAHRGQISAEDAATPAAQLQTQLEETRALLVQREEKLAELQRQNEVQVQVLERRLDELREQLAQREAALASLRQQLADRAAAIETRPQALASQESGAMPPAEPEPAQTTVAEAQAARLLQALPETTNMPPKPARTVQRADVYEAPHVESARIGVLEPGRELRLIGRSVEDPPHWYWVRTLQGAAGWVLAENVAPIVYEDEAASP